MNRPSEKLTFEKALYLALSKHNLLLPINDDQVKQFEKDLGETQNPPDLFSDPEKFYIQSSNLKTLSPPTQIDDLYSLKVASPSEDLGELNSNGNDDDKDDPNSPG